jgi:hypothetical protein
LRRMRWVGAAFAIDRSAPASPAPAQRQSQRAAEPGYSRPGRGVERGRLDRRAG